MCRRPGAKTNQRRFFRRVCPGVSCRGQHEAVGDVLQVGDGFDFVGDIGHFGGEVFGESGLGGARATGDEHLRTHEQFEPRATEFVAVAIGGDQQGIVAGLEPEADLGFLVAHGIANAGRERFDAHAEAFEAEVGGEHGQGDAGIARHAKEFDVLRQEDFVELRDELGAGRGGGELLERLIPKCVVGGGRVEGAAVEIAAAGVDAAEGDDDVL